MNTHPWHFTGQKDFTVVWMGGVPPVGYVAKGRTLEPDQAHVVRVREIYALCLKLNCIGRLSEAVQVKGWRSLGALSPIEYWASHGPAA